MPQKNPTVEDVRSYWQTHPLYSYEIGDVQKDQFFVDLDRIRRVDVERFAMPYWEFDHYVGRHVLDVGCGPGWIAVQYALGGAQVTAVDLTSTAVDLTQRHLRFRNVRAKVLEGNAEKLPFDSDTFDLVVSSGVLHHTPDTLQALRECCRVLKRGGDAKITLYRKGILHGRFVFPVTRAVMKWLHVKHPGADMAGTAMTVDDFIRQYDGSANPVGAGKTDREWSQLVQTAGFHVVGSERHFFPRRFLPTIFPVPTFVHWVFDRFFGTMIYFELRKDD